MKISDFLFKLANLEKPLFGFEEVNSKLGNELIGRNILILDSYARHFTDPDGNKRYLKFEPGFDSLKGSDKAAYYYDGGRVYLTKETLQLWGIHWDVFFEYLISSWQLTGALKQLDSNLWLLGMKNGISILFYRAKSESADKKLKELSPRILVVPCIFDCGSSSKTLLDQYLSLRDGVLYCDSLDDVINALNETPNIETDGTVLLAKEPNLRFSYKKRELYFYGGVGGVIKIRLGKAENSILNFLCEQCRGSNIDKYLNIHDFQKVETLSKLSERSIRNAISKIRRLSKNNNNFPILIEDDDDGRIKLNSNLYLVHMRRLKHSQMRSQKTL